MAAPVLLAPPNELNTEEVWVDVVVAVEIVPVTTVSPSLTPDTISVCVSEEMPVTT